MPKTQSPSEHAEWQSRLQFVFATLIAFITGAFIAQHEWAWAAFEGVILALTIALAFAYRRQARDYRKEGQ